MAAAFATLPCKVLWRLTPKEMPDQAAIAALKLGANTQAGRPLLPVPLSEQQGHRRDHAGPWQTRNMLLNVSKDESGSELKWAHAWVAGGDVGPAE